MTEQVHVSLREEQDRLWRTFYSQQNEMIVTKAGRKMFPKLEYIVRGLSPNKLYAMMLHIEQADDSRYKFSNGQWIKSGKAEPHKEPKKMWHADHVRSGKDWMASPICFDRVKITNSLDSTDASKVFLHSMHKYNPVLSIYESPSESPFSIPHPSTRLVTSVRLAYTEFIAVTAYQNDNIIKLKIEYNPFAKGFREGSQGDRKRNSPSADESTTDESSSTPPVKKTRNSSVSPPAIPRFIPTVIPPPIFNPFIYNFPYLSQFITGPPGPFPFPFGFPYTAPLQFDAPNPNKVEKKEEVKKEEIEPEINVV